MKGKKTNNNKTLKIDILSMLNDNDIEQCINDALKQIQVKVTCGNVNKTK